MFFRQTTRPCMRLNASQSRFSLWVCCCEVMAKSSVPSRSRCSIWLGRRSTRRMRTRGFFAWNAPMHSPSPLSTAVREVTPTVTSPTCISLMFSASSCSRRMLSTVNCAWRMMRRPSSVSDIPLWERCSRARPSSLSRSLIDRLMAGWVTCSICEASLMLPVWWIATSALI
ncbi:hypothetical protein D3C87_1395640 [compost metagenome]